MSRHKHTHCFTLTRPVYQYTRSHTAFASIHAHTKVFVFSKSWWNNVTVLYCIWANTPSWFTFIPLANASIQSNNVYLESVGNLKWHTKYDDLFMFYFIWTLLHIQTVCDKWSVELKCNFMMYYVQVIA